MYKFKTMNEIINFADGCENRFQATGEIFGYPECCIEQFVTLAVKDFWFDSLPWYGTTYLPEEVEHGFIPCEKCANKPLQRLVDDINSRREYVIPFGSLLNKLN